MINIFNRVISNKEKNILLDWVYENESKFVVNDAGPARKFYSFVDDPTLPELFWDVKKRIIKKEKVKPLNQPILLKNGYLMKDYIGWVSEGGHIHPHKDPLQDLLCQHVRYNLFLSVPKKGGIPIYNGERLRFKMRERGYLRCNSGNEVHGCDFVQGSKPRIVISYGVVLP